MIYKILMDFTKCLSDVIEILNKDFNVMFFNNVLYVSKKTPYIKTNIRTKIKQKDICIIEITENNLKNEPQPVIEWCRDRFVELDTIKFETEQQNVLTQMSDFIDRFEQNVIDIIKEKERGDDDG